MTAALIIAAGRTLQNQRLEPEKKLGTITAIQRAAMIFHRAGIQHIAAVCGEDRGKTEKLTAHMNLVFLPMEDSAQMLDSVKAGLNYLRGTCSSVLISPVNVPLFSIKTVHKLMNTSGPVVVPVRRGCPGYPILLQEKYFQNILSYTGDGGLDQAIRGSQLENIAAEVDDDGILANIQEREPCAHLVAEHDLNRLYPEFTLRLMKEQVFYDPTAHHLLQLVMKNGSLLEACRHAGISYTKGRAVIANLEQQLGRPVIKSRQGGKTGGSSTVTEAGTQLVEKYQNFCAEAQGTLEKIFEKHFGPRDW